MLKYRVINALTKITIEMLQVAIMISSLLKLFMIRKVKECLSKTVVIVKTKLNLRYCISSSFIVKYRDNLTI